ncbi:MAG: PilZ domain-containing protein [Candidatus Omnitrophota bacterium]|jgi:hypothetical protein
MINDFFAEKRRYPRIELSLDAKYKILDYEQVYQYGKTQNVSAEGVCFASGEPLKSGVYVQLEVDIKDGYPPVSMVAEIRWTGDVKAGRDKKYINGVKIVNMPAKDEARFLKYYCDKIVEKLSAYLK